MGTVVSSKFLIFAAFFYKKSLLVCLKTPIKFSTWIRLECNLATVLTEKDFELVWMAISIENGETVISYCNAEGTLLPQRLVLWNPTTKCIWQINFMLTAYSECLKVYFVPRKLSGIVLILLEVILLTAILHVAVSRWHCFLIDATHAFDFWLLQTLDMVVFKFLMLAGFCPNKNTMHRITRL